MVLIKNSRVKLLQFSPTFQNVNFSWLQIKFPDFSFDLEDCFFFPDLWQPYQGLYHDCTKAGLEEHSVPHDGLKPARSTEMQ